MKKTLILLGLGLASYSFAGDLVDVYGTSPQKSALILKKYGNTISHLELQIKNLERDEAIGKKINHKKFKGLLEKKHNILKEIKKSGDFIYANLETIDYFGKDFYTTIEVIEKTDRQRLDFISHSKKFKDPKKYNDAIEKFDEYTKLGYKLLLQKKLSLKEPACPVYHCIFGFKHPKLAPYLKIFNAAALNEKTKILEVLKSDPNPERRQNAAFLVGHFRDPKEMIKILTPYASDKDRDVRNNIIRVLADMERRTKLPMNLEPFLKLLDSPYETDRNKVLALFFCTLPNPESQKFLIEKARGQLIKLLALKQLNNHGWAYAILRQISGKNYGEYDLSAWNKWAASVV